MNRLLDKIEAEFNGKSEIPGYACLHYEQGSQQTLYGGILEINSQHKPSEQSLWHIGSCGKALTARLLRHSLEQSITSLQTSIYEVLSNEFEMTPQTHPISILDLVNHRSGLPNIYPDSIFREGFSDDGPAHLWRIRCLKYFFSRPHLFEAPKFLYSNWNYIFLGLIIESLIGAPYEDVLLDYFSNELNMRSLGFGPPPTSRAEVNPTGHFTFEGRLSSTISEPICDNPTFFSPAGRMHLNMADWQIFCKREMEFLKGMNEKELPKDNTAYTMGWGIGRTERGRYYQHSGTNRFWYATAVLCPSEDRSLLIALNSGTPQAEACLAKCINIFMERARE